MMDLFIVIVLVHINTIRSIEHDVVVSGMQLWQSDTQMSWHNSTLKCKLAGQNSLERSSFVGWAGAIYMNTKWMTSLGCLKDLKKADIIKTNITESPRIKCSIFCGNYTYVAYKGSECACYQNEPATVPRHGCDAKCNCGENKFYMSYKHVPDPSKSHNQRLRCAIDVRQNNHTTTSTQGTYMAVNCDHCKINYTCIELIRMKYIKWIDESHNEKYHDASLDWENILCLLMNEKNGTIRKTEEKCGRRHHAICENVTNEQTPLPGMTSQSYISEDRADTLTLEQTLGVQSRTKPIPLTYTNTMFATTDQKNTTDVNEVMIKTTVYDSTIIPDKHATLHETSKGTWKPSTTEPWKYMSSTGDGYTNLKSAIANNVTKKNGRTTTSNIDYEDSPYTEYTILALIVSAVLLIAVIVLSIWYKRRKAQYKKSLNPFGGLGYFKSNDISEADTEIEQRKSNTESIYCYTSPVIDFEYGFSRVNSSDPTETPNALDGEYNTLNFTLRNSIYTIGTPANVANNVQKKSNTLRKSINFLRSPFKPKPKDGDVAAYYSSSINFHDIIYNVPKFNEDIHSFDGPIRANLGSLNKDNISKAPDRTEKRFKPK